MDEQVRPDTEEHNTVAEDEISPEHSSAMRGVFNSIADFVADRVFGGVVIHESSVRKIRDLAKRGTVVYVLRHRSLIDYFLVNYVLRREGLPLPVFANGVTTTVFAPFAVILRRLRAALGRVLNLRREQLEGLGHDYCAAAVKENKPVLIFMRGRRARVSFSWGRRGPTGSRVGTDYLREVVHGLGSTERFVVPLALFRGHSFRKRETGLSAVIYSVEDAPSDTRKLFAYWWNRNDLFITVGMEVAMSEFSQRYSEDSEERLARRLSRAVQIFLQREERVVLGPALQSRRRVKATVLENEEMAAGIRKIADETHDPVGKLRKQAEVYFEEMAANFNGIAFGVIAYVFQKLWRRMFSGLETINFEQVVDKVRHHPVVLVPCHRSHFDYLVITYLFHLNFVSPPHIFAGANMAFWPMGPIFRAAGAYFVRRSFREDELYKLVFQQYLSYLIKEGYTQEFFIEGGRSRTGKMMTPKLGMLSAIVSSFVGGVRSDLFLVPVSIHYGRVVEEAAYQHELLGGEKETESIGALLKARRFLKQKYGAVYASFGEPISLADALGDNRGRFSEGSGVPEVEEELRRFVQKLGFRILRGVNDVSVAGATSISCTVLLGATHAGMRYEDFRQQANALARLIRQQDIPFTSSLERNLGDFRESVSFLESNDLVEVIDKGHAEALVVKQGRRVAMDFYKNNLIHAFLVPSLVTSILATGCREEELTDKVWWWLELFRFEFALPERGEISRVVGDVLAYYREEGAVVDTSLQAGHPLSLATRNVLECFKEGYRHVAMALRDDLDEDGVQEKILLEQMRTTYRTGMLVGETQRMEGGSAVTFANALRRYEEMGFVSREHRGRGGREIWMQRGDNYDALQELAVKLGRSLEEAGVVS